MENQNALRLDAEQRFALEFALQELEDCGVYLFGSRLDPCQRGGGIDILIFSKADPFQLSQQTSVRFFEKCEEKIDVTVIDPKKLTQEQQGFSKSDPKTADQVSETGQEVLVRTASQKTLDAIALVEAPLGQISVYDVGGNYTPEELEPYDALCD